MKSTGILMSTPMVRAILEGRKTQTRRVLKFEPEQCQVDTLCSYNAILRACPYGGPGDEIWVRETWMPCDTKFASNEVEILYKATNDIRPDGVSVAKFGASRLFERPEEEVQEFRRDIERMEVMGDRWRPSIFMPRWASRIARTLTAVRVERLQDISVEDCIAEGLSTNLRESEACVSLKEQYENLWTRINGKKHPWASNPWVWVLEWKNP